MLQNCFTLLASTPPRQAERERSRVMRMLRRTTALLTTVALLLALAGVSALSASAAPRRAAPAGISASRCAANKAAGTIKFLSPFGYDASAGILDVYAALQRGYFHDLCLDVTFNGGFNSAVYTDVSAGVGTVSGQGSAADDLAAVASGAHYTAISTFGDTSDYVLLTRAAITNLRQLAGKTLAYHTVLPVVLTEMLQKAGVDVAKVHEVNDNSYTPSLLIKGPYQALQAYGTKAIRN